MKHDKAQLNVLKHYDSLYDQCLGKVRLQKQSMYTYGGVGCGKTMLMDLFYELLPMRCGEQKKRTHFAKFMRDFHMKFHRLKKEKGQRVDVMPFLIEELCSETQVLCFDEFQVTDIADAMILKRLFSEMFAHDMTIVATSNRAPQELYHNGINRESFLPFIAYLEEKAYIHNMESANDYRLASTQRTNVYISSGNLKNDNEILMEIFEKFVGDKATPDFITVGSRMVQVPLSYRGVALFDFKDLCDSYLASGDYIELAKKYHTVFLKNIRKMKSDQFDQLKRFIALIDELYQQNVKLICTAEDLPMNLLDIDREQYKNVEVVFAFDRCTSRLIEMQSEEYLQRAR